MVKKESIELQNISEPDITPEVRIRSLKPESPNDEEFEIKSDTMVKKESIELQNISEPDIKSQVRMRSPEPEFLELPVFEIKSDSKFMEGSVELQVKIRSSEFELSDEISEIKSEVLMRYPKPELLKLPADLLEIETDAMVKKESEEDEEESKNHEDASPALSIESISSNESCHDELSPPPPPTTSYGVEFVPSPTKTKLVALVTFVKSLQVRQINQRFQMWRRCIIESDFNRKLDEISDCIQGESLQSLEKMKNKIENEYEANRMLKQQLHEEGKIVEQLNCENCELRKNFEELQKRHESDVEESKAHIDRIVCESQLEMSKVQNEMLVAKESESHLRQVLSTERNERAAVEGELASLRFDKIEADGSFTEIENAIQKSQQIETELLWAQSQEKLHAEKTFELSNELKLLKTENLKLSKQNLKLKSNIERIRNVSLEHGAGQTEEFEKYKLLSSSERENVDELHQNAIDKLKIQLDGEYRMIIQAMTAARQRLETRLAIAESEQISLRNKLEEQRFVTTTENRITERASNVIPSSVAIKVKELYKTICDKLEKKNLKIEDVLNFSENIGIPVDLKDKEIFMVNNSKVGMKSFAVILNEICLRFMPPVKYPDPWAGLTFLFNNYSKLSSYCSSTQLFASTLSRVWHKERGPLKSIFSHYSCKERDSKIQAVSELDNKTHMHLIYEGLTFDGLLQLAKDFALVPSVLSRSDLRAVFDACELDDISGFLSYEKWLEILQNIATKKFPKCGSVRSGNDFDSQIFSLLQWLDVSDGKNKLRNRTRSTGIIRKFHIPRLHK